MSQIANSAGKSAGFLTLKYGGAAASIAGKSFCGHGHFAYVVSALDRIAYSASSPVLNGLAKLGLVGNNGVILLAVAAVVFSAAGLFPVSARYPRYCLRPNYVNSTPYAFITNAFVGVVAFVVS